MSSHRDGCNGGTEEGTLALPVHRLHRSQACRMVLMLLVYTYSCMPCTTLNVSTRSMQQPNKRYGPGELVNNYQIFDRIDYLGYQKRFRKDSELHTYLSMPSVNGEGLQNASLTPVREVRVDANDSCIQNGTYCLKDHIFRGGHGDVYRAHWLLDDGKVDESTSYVLKRMNVHDRPDIEKCALREIFFGMSLKHLPLVSRFVTYFTQESDYWLVFKDEGVSLQKLLYAITLDEHNVILKPSNAWKKLRTTQDGQTSMRKILQQVMMGVADLHRAGVYHRDIKPSNILMNTDNEPTFIMADFSSAISEEVLNHGHYEPSGPSKRELTLQYAAPEIYLAGDNDAYNTSLSESYDIWGIGVLFLELILGTENVFEVDQRTAAMISSRLEHRRRFHDYGKLLEKTLFLAGLADYCIFQPPQENGDIQNGDAISISAVSGAESDRSTVITKVQNLIDSTSNPDSAQEKEESTECLSNHLHPIVQRSQCGIGEFRRAILRRDILGIGFHDLWGLDLLYRLLRWDPDQRMRIDDALRHAYFVGPYVSAVDGSEHATEDDMKTHEAHQSIKREKQEDKNAMPRDSDDMNRELKSTSDSSRAADSTRASSLGDMRIAQYILREDDDTEATPSGEVRYLSPAIIEESFNLTFFCPKCMRKFSDWQACQHHMSSRRHGRRCAYEPSSPSPCLSEHSMLPIDRGSGWCDLQGRRRYVEDEHAIIFSDKYKFFGVFDGHFGNRAARFVARQLHGMFAIYSQTDFLKFSRTENVERNASPSEELLASTQMQGDSNSGSDELPSTLPTDEKWAEEAAQRMDEANDNDSWQDVVELSNLKEFVAMSREEDSLTIHDALSALKMAFLRTDSEFQRVTSAQERSGTTATVVIVFENHIMVGHVGDSRVVLCCSPGGQAMQLTADHTPYLKREKARVLSLGGEVKGEAVLRVNGVLAVTRSIGDVALKPLLTAEPDLLALRRTPIFVEKNDTMEGSALPRARASALAPASSSSDNTASNNESDCFAYRRKIFQAIQESLGGEIQDELIIWENVRKSQLFLIVASDGLWDVVSNDDGSELVCDFLMKQMTSIDAYASFLPADAFHNAAKLLAHEALVRGASDNIGVCVVNLLDFEQYRADAGAYR